MILPSGDGRDAQLLTRRAKSSASGIRARRATVSQNAATGSHSCLGVSDAGSQAESGASYELANLRPRRFWIADMEPKLRASIEAEPDLALHQLCDRLTDKRGRHHVRRATASVEQMEFELQRTLHASG